MAAAAKESGCEGERNAHLRALRSSCLFLRQTCPAASNPPSTLRPLPQRPTGPSAILTGSTYLSALHPKFKPLLCGFPRPHPPGPRKKKVPSQCHPRTGTARPQPSFLGLSPELPMTSSPAAAPGPSSTPDWPGAGCSSVPSLGSLSHNCWCQTSLPSFLASLCLKMISQLSASTTRMATHSEIPKSSFPPAI